MSWHTSLWRRIAAEMASSLLAVLAAIPPSQGPAGAVELDGCEALDDFEDLERMAVAEPTEVFRRYLDAASAMAGPLDDLAHRLPRSSPLRREAEAVLGVYLRARTVDEAPESNIA